MDGKNAVAKLTTGSLNPDFPLGSIRVHCAHRHPGNHESADVFSLDERAPSRHTSNIEVVQDGSTDHGDKQKI